MTHYRQYRGGVHDEDPIHICRSKSAVETDFQNINAMKDSEDVIHQGRIS